MTKRQLVCARPTSRLIRLELIRRLPDTTSTFGAAACTTAMRASPRGPTYVYFGPEVCVGVHIIALYRIAHYRAGVDNRLHITEVTREAARYVHYGVFTVTLYPRARFDRISRTHTYTMINGVERRG